MTWSLGVLVAGVSGVALGVFLSGWLVRTHPTHAERLGLIAPYPIAGEDYEPGPPAIDPWSIPVSTTNQAAETEADAIDHPNLRRLVSLLKVWNPKRHRAESGYHHSLRTFLIQQGFSERDIRYQPRINRRGEAPQRGESWAIPDFIVGDVLVEIKMDFDMTASADRAVGQVTRYLHYWRKHGPSLLLVCNEFHPGLREIVDSQVGIWKKSQIPVMAHYVRSP